VSEEGRAPKGWTEATLEKIVGPDGVFCDGDWVESKDQDPSGDVRLVQLADIGDGTFQDRSSRFLTSLKAAELRCTFLKVGDVLVARMPQPLGRACTFPGDAKRCITVVDVCVLRPPLERCFSLWLMYAINSPRFRVAVSALQRGTTRKRIARRDLAALTLPVPPLPEQRRIVAEVEKHLTRLDAGVASLRRVQANLKRYRASVLKAACEGRLVPTEAALARAEGRGYEPADRLLERILHERRARWEGRGAYKPPAGPQTEGLPTLPEGWTWSTVETVGEVLLGRRRAPEYESRPVTRKYLRVANVYEDRFDLSDVNSMNFDVDEAQKYTLQPDDILLSEGQSPELVGRSAIFRGEVEDLCFQATLHRFRRYKSAPTAAFCQIVFRAFLHNGTFQKVSSQTVNIAHLTLERLKPLHFPLPPASEQSRIVAEVERRLSIVDGVAASVEASLARAERLRQAILKSAIEGRLVPQDPTDEPASVMLEQIRDERVAEVAGGRAGDGAGRKGKSGARPRRAASGTGEGR